MKTRFIKLRFYFIQRKYFEYQFLKFVDEIKRYQIMLAKFMKRNFTITIIVNNMILITQSTIRNLHLVTSNRKLILIETQIETN